MYCSLNITFYVFPLNNKSSIFLNCWICSFSSGISSMHVYFLSYACSFFIIRHFILGGISISSFIFHTLPFSYFYLWNWRCDCNNQFSMSSPLINCRSFVLLMVASYNTSNIDCPKNSSCGNYIRTYYWCFVF